MGSWERKGTVSRHEGSWVDGGLGAIVNISVFKGSKERTAMPVPFGEISLRGEEEVKSLFLTKESMENRRASGEWCTCPSSSEGSTIDRHSDDREK